MNLDAAAWKAYFESQRAYYLDPDIQWFHAGDLADYGISAAGYYVLGSCGEPGCCLPSGPFSTVEEAHQYSRQHLVAGETEREAARVARHA